MFMSTHDELNDAKDFFIVSRNPYSISQSYAISAPSTLELWGG
jgi:hypothetical protein